MNRKKRKSLDDSLASEFVFGGNEAEESEPPSLDKPKEEVTAETESTSITPMPEKPAKKSNKESTLMQKLQLEAKEPTKRFTIDLQESVHRKLSILAAKTGRTKADIVRMLLDDALENIDE